MIIRKAGEGDIPGINRLLEQVLMVHHNGRPDLFKSGAKKYTDDEIKDILLDPSRPVFAAIEEGKMVGYAFCVHQQEVNHHILTDIKTLYIDDLCVEETKRGMHIGNALFEYVKEYAKEKGYYNITLNVWSCNPGALRFYEKGGLVPQKIGMEMIL